MLCFFLLVALILSGCAKHYPVRGMVLRVDRQQQKVFVSHRDIPNLMPAMTMPFRVHRADDLDGLAPGTQVEFDLVISRKQSYARRFRKTAASLEGVVEDQGERIVLAPLRDKVAIGQAVPDFELTDQSGRTVRLSDLRGKVVAVNFIYTRCPLPDVCPRLSANFARIQSRFSARMGKDLVLLSITIDPGYDTPDVLLGYAKIWKADATGWRFLTGPQERIASVAGRFGLHFWAEEGMITHTSETGVIGRNGRLAALVAGSGYAASQLGDLIAGELEEK
ncbi:MAG: SCO family protein [Bryobacteraceae bacterium]